MSIHVTNCREGELLIQGPQCEIDKLLAVLNSAHGVTVQQPPKKPEPMPDTAWNWTENNSMHSHASQFASAAALSSGERKPSPIPDPPNEWKWEPSPDSQMVLN